MVKFENATLHTMAPLPNPRRVGIFLAEKGLEIDQNLVNVQKGEHKSEEFKKKNMDGRVPVLELEDGTFLSETVAITQYIEDMTPDINVKLFGDNTLERAKASMWNRRIEIEFIGYVALASRYGPLAKMLNYPKIDEMSDECLKVAKGFISRLDAELENKKFVTFGDRVSMADISMFCWFDYAVKGNKWDLVGDNKNIGRWYNDMLALDSVKANPGMN